MKKAVKDRYDVGDTGVIRIRERGTDITKIYGFEVTSKPRPEGVSNLPEMLRDVKLEYKGSVKNYASLMVLVQ